MLETIRSRPVQASHPFLVPRTHGRRARQSEVQLSFGSICVMAPRWEKRCGTEPLPLWAIRVWEEDTPADEEPLEWLLLTSVPTTTIAQAWEHVQWYACRWTVEDSHQCLKTGCRIEERQVQSVARLIRLLGLLSPLAVRLLQLRNLARCDPQRPAQEVVEHDVLALVATHTDRIPGEMSTATFWKAVAQLGGYLGRRGDGPAGWKTLWKGWLRVQAWLEGVHLAFHLLL
ncbi:IS4 family transposase [Ktedonosporobacter rubrisoli]|uniref:IS4 family transposase n=1 Tax=Ktedonosporobacter rubrisoli TaxID=2509675 RepID=UPI001F5DF304|nr:IS4 family transposase [Ktedonosporobacter rubrisoli]